MREERTATKRSLLRPDLTRLTKRSLGLRGRSQHQNHTTSHGTGDLHSRTPAYSAALSVTSIHSHTSRVTVHDTGARTRARKVSRCADARSADHVAHAAPRPHNASTIEHVERLPHGAADEGQGRLPDVCGTDRRRALVQGSAQSLQELHPARAGGLL